MADQTKNQKQVGDVLKNIPVPVPGSSFKLLDMIRQHLMDVQSSTQKKKKQGSEGNSDQ